MAIPKNVFLGLIYKFPFTGITALRLCVLASKNVRLYALSQKETSFVKSSDKRGFLLLYTFFHGIISLNNLELLGGAAFSGFMYLRGKRIWNLT